MSARRKEGETCEVSGRHPRSHWLVNEQSFIYHINSCPSGTRPSQEGSQEKDGRLFDVRAHCGVACGVQALLAV
jgi:hypothetical protein